MDPRTRHQQLQLLMAAIMLINAPLSFYSAAHWLFTGWLGYGGAVAQLASGLMFLWFGLSRKERP